MKSRATVFGHPVHQILVAFPIGTLAFATGCDVLGLTTGRRRWFRLADSTLVAGIVGAVVAAPFGLVDYLAIPANTRAKRVGLTHGLGNAVVSALFVASWAVRKSAPKKRGLASALSLAGFSLAGVTAWLGGELINRLGVGVEEPTSFDAPPSYREEPIAGAVARAAVGAAHRVASINP